MDVGFVLLFSERPGIPAPSYPEIRTTAQRVEELGFNSLWLYDHLLYRQEGETTGIWECFSMLAALAEVTDRVTLGPLVACTQFRNPALLAKMAVTIDEICGGRLILGVGAGWNEPEFEAFGYPFDHRAGRFEEALAIIAPLLREGCVDFEGRYYSARDCVLAPRGPHEHGPPILLGGWGPRMLRLCARYADRWNSGYISSPEQLREPLANLRETCRQEGRDPDTLGLTALLRVADPSLEEPPSFMGDNFVTGIDAVVVALQGLEELGVVEVMFEAFPRRPETQEMLGEAVEKYRIG